MTTLRHWVNVSEREQPYVHFESSLDDDQVVAGYVPVKSTLDVLSFLKDAAATHASQGRAVICYGSYGSGKSRLCAVLARMFRDGFDCGALEPVWSRLAARGESERLDELKLSLMPGAEAWRPWLVVPIYAGGHGSSFSTCLVRGLSHAVNRAGLDESVLGTTIYRAAALRLDEMVKEGAEYTPVEGSPHTSVEQLRRALEADFAEVALEEFRGFHRRSTFGMEFDDWARHAGGVSMEAHDVYNTVVEKIQRHGYRGIVVIWDEFGFFVEELLRGAGQAIRSLGREAMSIQNFIERSCSSSQLGRQIVFLGFTHVSLTEYGSRQGLADTDRDRLSTVSDRFRDPSIPIRLSVTENEGYYLLAGMIHRTDEGKQILSQPVPGLQRLASVMPDYPLWDQLTSSACYDDVATACYPLHPSAAAALLLLSDQVAQEARTAFYYLQNRDQNGLVGVLEHRDLPKDDNIGSRELVRVDDLFEFFEQAIAESKRLLYDQFREAVARFPDATEFELSILRATLILSVIASRDMAPTTDFLCFCLCDVVPTDAKARRLHDALCELREAGSLWNNEATDVWGFVGTQGVSAGIEKDLEAEKHLVPKTAGAALLLRKFPEIQPEVIDLLGDFDLDPADSGIIRRIGIRFLDIGRGHGEQALERVNPVRDHAEVCWRSAMIYLVATDSETELTPWRDHARSIKASNTYFVVPTGPLEVDRERMRELIAVRHLLEKTDAESHAYEVLEGKLTRLRSGVRRGIERAFGNSGLRLGTVVVRAGQGETTVPVSSWSELLPSIAADLARDFDKQIRVRCGAFNEWRTGQAFSAIEKIVMRILAFDDNPEWHDQFLGFTESSQEGAIVDGVLVENGFLVEETLSGKWNLVDLGDGCDIEALVAVLKHFQAGGAKDKEVSKLFVKLISPPYGLPNGIIPLLIAIVFRTEGARLAIYTGAQNQRVTEAKTANAIMNMGRRPDKYRTRYSKLTNKQRVVFRAIAQETGVTFTDRLLRGEAFYEQCERIRSSLKGWGAKLPDLVLTAAELNEPQRHVVKLLKAQISPQLPVLADGLIEMFNVYDDSRDELAAADASTTAFPILLRRWRGFRTTVERYVDGVRAPLRATLREVAEVESTDNTDTSDRLVDVLKSIDDFGTEDNPIRDVAERLSDVPADADPLEEIAVAISKKSADRLTEEDYGRAVGVLEVAGAIKRARAERESNCEYEVLLPDGKRRVFHGFQNEEAATSLASALDEVAKRFSLTLDQVVVLILQTLISGEEASLSPRRQDVSTDTDCVSPSSNEAVGGEGVSNGSTEQLGDD